MDDCDWMNPREHDVYESNLRQEETDPWLTPYGHYLIYGGTQVANDTYFKMWKGMIDGKIPLTFFLWVNNVMVLEGHGWEIYDRHMVSQYLFIYKSHPMTLWKSMSLKAMGSSCHDHFEVARW